MSEPLAAERRVALEAVVEACRFCRSVQQDLVPREVQIKSDRSPVTVADYGAQAIVNRALARAFPDDPILAEEELDALGAPLQEQLIARLPGLTAGEILDGVRHGSGGTRGARRWWTLDPIDGTKGFLRRGQYAVALALVEEGEVTLGVLGCPSLGSGGSIFTAVRGRGCRARSVDDASERPVRVAASTDPADAVLVESVEAEHSDQAWAQRAAERLGVRAAPLHYDSQVKYGAVAQAEASVYLRLLVDLDYREKVWDHAAGCLVVTEAGGRVTDIDGRPLDFSAGAELGRSRGVVATNGPLHERVLEALRETA